MFTNWMCDRLKRENSRRLHSVVAPKILCDASIVVKMKIVCCAGIGCCGGDGQAGFAGDKSPEMNETTNRFAS